MKSILLIGLLAPAHAKYLILERSNGRVVYIPLVAVAQTPEGNRYFTVIHDFFNPDLLGHLSRRHGSSTTSTPAFFNASTTFAFSASGSDA